VTLIVDDDASILAAWARALRRSGQVLTATDLSTGLRLATVVVPTTAIVDMRLGNDSGLPLVRALRRRSKVMRIAVVSGYLSVDSTVAAVKAGADVVVGKPVTPTEVMRRLASPSEDVDPKESASIRRIEWQHVHGTLADTNGNISQAARRLKIFRVSLQRKLRKPMPPF
jgi:two-component system response regulator RegA